MFLRTIGLICLLLGGAVATVGLGLSFPIHFRAVSPLLLEEAAAGTPTLEDRADDFLSAGMPGPVALFAQAQPSIMDDRWRTERQAELFEAQPYYRFSGGPAPYFERFLENINPPESTSSAPVIPLVLPREHRTVLRGFLRTSNNTAVQNLLTTRELSGYQHFLPAFSNAGHPLDAAILVTALIEQSGAWQPAISRQLRALAATAGDDAFALQELERIYLAVVTLANRTNWTQLTALLEQVPDPETLNKLAAATHRENGDFAALYSAILLSRDAPAMLAYLEQEPEEGWRVMRFALGLGQGALSEMASFDQPLYEPPAFLAALPLKPVQDALKGYTQRHPQFAFVLKTAALLIGGYCLAMAAVLLLRLLFSREPAGTHQRQPLEFALHAISAVALAAIVWVIAEPRLLEFAPNAATELRLNLAQVLPESNLSSTAPSTDMIDQVTLIVLLMFFVIQLAVFAFSLIRISAIRGQDVAATVKLSLLDNEEPLFDLGLYVGLGGTVSSLILIVLEFVEASLMAAYASTLFGIIFVAFLKIIFLRPYRRRLILEAHQ